MSEEIKQEIIDEVVQDFIACRGDCTKCKASLKVDVVIDVEKYKKYLGLNSFTYCVLLMQYKKELVERIIELLDNC